MSAETSDAIAASSGGKTDATTDNSMTSTTTNTMAIEGPIPGGSGVGVVMSNRKLWALLLLAITLGLLIAWGVVRLTPCESPQPTPAPWPTILERDDEITTLDMESDQASGSSVKRID